MKLTRKILEAITEKEFSVKPEFQQDDPYEPQGGFEIVIGSQLFPAYTLGHDFETIEEAVALAKAEKANIVAKSKYADDPEYHSEWDYWWAVRDRNAVVVAHDEDWEAQFLPTGIGDWDTFVDDWLHPDDVPPPESAPKKKVKKKEGVAKPKHKKKGKKKKKKKSPDQPPNQPLSWDQWVARVGALLMRKYKVTWNDIDAGFGAEGSYESGWAPEQHVQWLADKLDLSSQLPDDFSLGSF